MGCLHDNYHAFIFGGWDAFLFAGGLRNSVLESLPLGSLEMGFLPISNDIFLEYLDYSYFLGIHCSNRIFFDPLHEPLLICFRANRPHATSRLHFC